MQSSVCLLLAARREIPRFDAAVFADTGWEPAAVYAQLDRLEAIAAAAGIPIVRVSAGNIRHDALDPAHRFASMPLFTLGPNGERGMARRQCTSEYKIKPIKAEVRRRLGYPHPARVPAGVAAEIAIGISVDEIHRARDADVAYMRNVFPLLELGWRRSDRVAYLERHGLSGIGKSSCLGCLIWNLACLPFSTMIEIPWDKFPLVDGHEHAHRWLQFYANIGRAPNTIIAYGRAVDDVRTIQVLIDRESILTGTAAGGEQPWKYYDLGDGYCSYDFFAKCPHRLACAKCSFYLPKQSNAGQLLAVKDGIDQMLEQLDLTDDERAALEGDREALTALANRLADVATPSGPTPNELGNGAAFIPLTALRASLREGPP